MASAFQRTGEKIWTASYKDQFGRWRQRKGRASRAETFRIAQELEDDARRKRLMAPADKLVGSRDVLLAVEEYGRHLSLRRKSARQVSQAVARLKRVFIAAGIQRMEEIESSRIADAISSFCSQQGKHL